MGTRRVAVIDVGTNSVRLDVADIAGGRVEPVCDKRAYVRLGQGLDETGRIRAASQDRLIRAVRRLERVALDRGATDLVAIATSAIREAPNGAEVSERVWRDTGVRLRVLDAVEEGRLAFVSARNAFSPCGRWSAFDLGGGSLEVVLGDGGDVVRSGSAPLGALVLTERFVGSDPLSPGDHAALLGHVRDSLDAVVAGVGPAPLLVGSGGTARAISGMTLGPRLRRVTDARPIGRATVDALAERLVPSTAAQRRQVPGLPKKRSDIITAGVIVVAELMRALEAADLLVNPRGIRDGLLLEAAWGETQYFVGTNV